MLLEGRAALVTGASRGLGRAIALALAREGAGVAVHGSKASRELVEAAEEVRALGARVAPVAFDATRRAAVEQGVAHAAGQLGGLDILVHAVGANVDGALLDLGDAPWDRAVEVNLRSAFLCTQAAARAMRAGGPRPAGAPGRIVLLASASALTGRRGAANYAAAKAGVIALGKSAALELAPDVLVNVLAPGVFDTPSVHALFDAEHLREVERAVPLGRLGRPEELAEAALFLCGPEARYITGQVLAVDGGRTMRHG